MLQQDLARRGIEQVGTTHDLGDALRGIVHDHRQLVGPQPVGAAQHEIANFGIDTLLDMAADRVIEGNQAAIRHP